MKIRNSLLLGITIGLVVSSIFVAGFAAGILFTRSQPAEFSTSDRDLRDFLSAYRLVTQHAYNQHLSHRKLLYAAIDGMLSATGDAHTIFLSPDQNRSATSDLNGSEYAGIGAIVRPARQGLRILAPLPQTPSARAGLRSEDLVTRIDGKLVTSMTGDDAIALIHGKPGSIVRLTVVRGASHRLTLKVRRAQIPPITAYGRSLGQKLAYIQIFRFGATTGHEVQTALVAARRAGARGIVLDLRQNPGGYVNAAQDVVSEFLDHGIVAYERTSDGGMHPLNVVSGQRQTSVPVTILVDGGTASAAEITAAALRDEDHAVLIGTRTYGKGSMQSVYTLPDGSSVRITDRLWFTPKKRSIQGRGLAPNIFVSVPTGQTDESDPQLRTAERYLLTHPAR